MHTSSAGSGDQRPSATQSDVLCCDGANPGLHWKTTAKLLPFTIYNGGYILRKTIFGAIARLVY